MSIENFNYQFCVECGNPDIREPFKNGHKQCNDRSCLQEFFDDVDYGDILVFPSDYVKKLSSELASAKTVLEKYKKALRVIKDELPKISGYTYPDNETRKALKEIKEVLNA